MKINVFSIMALLVLLLAFPLDAAQNDVPVSSCGEITESSYLTQDLVAAPKCLFISGSNLVLDCDGHSIIGPNETNTGQGLDVSIGIEGRGLSNVTITGCTIAGVDFGISLEGVTNVAVDNNTIYNYFIYGTYIASNGDTNEFSSHSIARFLGNVVTLESSNPSGAFDVSVYGNTFRDNSFPSSVGINLDGRSVTAQVVANELLTSAESDVSLAGTGLFTVDQNVMSNGNLFSDEALTLDLGSNLPAVAGSTLASAVYGVSFSSTAGLLYKKKPKPVLPSEKVKIKAMGQATLQVTPRKTVTGEFVKLTLNNSSFKVVNTRSGAKVGGGNKVHEVWVYINMTNPQVPTCWAYYKNDNQNKYVRHKINSKFGVRYALSGSETMTFTCTPEGYVNVADVDSAKHTSSSWLVKTHEYEPPVPPEPPAEAQSGEEQP